MSMQEFIPNAAMLTRSGAIRPIRVLNVQRDNAVQYEGMDGQTRVCGLGNLRDLSEYDSWQLRRQNIHRERVNFVATTYKIRPVTWEVEHPTDSERNYTVFHYSDWVHGEEWACTCPDFESNKITCKHIDAVKEKQP